MLLDPKCTSLQPSRVAHQRGMHGLGTSVFHLVFLTNTAFSTVWLPANLFGRLSWLLGVFVILLELKKQRVHCSVAVSSSLLQGATSPSSAIRFPNKQFFQIFLII